MKTLFQGGWKADRNVLKDAGYKVDASKLL